MLDILIPGVDLWDEKENRFIKVPQTTLKLEHSLFAISKWESFYKKPFLSKDDKKYDETIYYIKCMTIEPVDDNVYYALSNTALIDIQTYIADKKTATFFLTKDKDDDRHIVTSEEIYYWMIASDIPFSCDKWHLSRLMTLIKVCNEKNKKQKPMSEKELYQRNAKLKAARRKNK